LVSAGSYASPSGTSFSAPMVTGAAAILKQCGVPLDQIESTLRNSANVTVPFPDGSSAPRLDIYRALQSRNTAPTAVNLSNTSLNDGTNTAGGVEVGTLTATDPDTCDKHTYSIVGGTDATKFSIGGTASDRLILTDGVLHSATKSSYSVVVRVTDFFGATFDQTLTVTVNAVSTNHAPNISNQVFSINDGSANNTVVGTVVASDSDAGDTISYSITGGNTNNAFVINPGTGVLSVSNSTAVSYATSPTFSLIVKVTDTGALFATATITVNVNAPSAVTPPSPPPPPASSGGGKGGCSVMPAGADPDLSLVLAVLVMLGYGVRRRRIGSSKPPY
jgi:MYXO-CTERM domain-containing protein